MDYDSLSEEELQDRLSNLSPTDLGERIALRAALDRCQARKRQWTRGEKISASAVLVTLLIGAAGGAYKLLHPDKPNPAPAKQTDTSQPTVPPTDTQTSPKANPGGPTVAPIPNPKMPAEKTRNGFARQLSNDDAKELLLGSTWVGQVPVGHEKAPVNVQYRFEPDGTVSLKCDDQDLRCAALTLPSGKWTLHSDGTVDIVFSDIGKSQKEIETNIGKSQQEIETNQQPIAANQFPIRARAMGKVADNSIQGYLSTGGRYENWTLTKR